MAAFDFPSSPTVGQTYTPAGGGPTYSWNGVSWNVVAVNVSGGFSQQTFTATLGQTVFTVTAGYQIGLLDVFQNGVKLVAGADYTATNGTTLVLSAPAALGDTIQTISYAAISGANTYTKAESDARFNGRGLFYAYGTASVSVPVNTNTKLTSTETADVDNWYDPALSRYNPKIAGLYQITIGVQADQATSGLLTARIGVNGGGAVEVASGPLTPAYVIPCGTGLFVMNGTTDYLEPMGHQTGAGPVGIYLKQFHGVLVRAT